MVQKVQKGRDDERQSWTAPRLALTTGQRVQMVAEGAGFRKYRLTQTRARFTPQRTNYGLSTVQATHTQVHSTPSNRSPGPPDPGRTCSRPW